jgi:choline dehydrogenase
MNEHFDHVIVGGGTAGCILAARLSEDPAHTVLLLEAGEDYAPGTTPGAVLDAKYVPMRGHAPTFDAQHDWGLTAHSRGGAGISVPQARIIGGGSAINGGIALRGAHADYAEWADFGNPEWTWEKVLPFFVAMENDPAPGDFHGQSGQVPINRATEEELATLQAAFIESATAAGAEYVYDLNAPDAHGVGPVPQTRVGDRRMSTAETHLEPARGRANLTVRGDALVSRVRFEGDRAVGVELADGTVVDAGEVVLAAGAILTPAILQRSGVGPRDVVDALGVDLVIDLPVGDNLGDHFSIPLMAVPKPGAWDLSHFSLQTALRMSTKAQPNSLDGQLTMFSYLNARTTGEGTKGIAGTGSADIENVAGIGCVLNKPRSVGTVRATTTDPASVPQVDPNYLDQPVDWDAIRELVRVGWDVISRAPLADLLEAPIGITAELVADDAALDAFIEANAASGYHFTGTCLMAPRERGGVVDQQGLVHGLRGLRVADASIVPTTPAANSMLTTIMVAERVSAMIVDNTVQASARSLSPAAG